MAATDHPNLNDKTSVAKTITHPVGGRLSKDLPHVLRRGSFKGNEEKL